MNLIPSPDQMQIVDALKDFLQSEASLDRFKEHGAIGNPDVMLWPQLGELGFMGLALSQDQGGAGLTAAEEFLMFREFGRNLISPGIFGLTLGARIAASCKATELRDQLLSGTLNVGIANPFGNVEIGKTCGGDFHLFEAKQASWVLVLSEEGAALIHADKFSDRQDVNAMDAILTLERTRLEQTQPDFWVDIDQEPLYTRALLLSAAYAEGMSEATRDMAVEYAKVREQFGKPIGSFQAVKHICANMAIRTEAALCQTSFASLVLAEGRTDSDYQVTSSKIVASDTALKNGADNIQVHGAFGFTAEANAHHYLKRAHVIDRLWGDLKDQRKRLLGLPRTAQ